jgi:hypothetical protein
MKRVGNEGERVDGIAWTSLVSLMACRLRRELTDCDLKQKKPHIDSQKDKDALRL